MDKRVKVEFILVLKKKQKTDILAVLRARVHMHCASKNNIKSEKCRWSTSLYILWRRKVRGMLEIWDFYLSLCWEKMERTDRCFQRMDKVLTDSVQHSWGEATETWIPFTFGRERKRARSKYVTERRNRERKKEKERKRKRKRLLTEAAVLDPYGWYFFSYHFEKKFHFTFLKAE